MVVSEALQGTVPLPLPMITHLPVPVVGLRAGVGAAVWELSGALRGKVLRSLRERKGRTSPHAQLLSAPTQCTGTQTHSRVLSCLCPAS